MIPIVSIVGKSESGKTTFIEKLVPELVRRGYRVATVKHDIHGFEIDREGKDSWRHKKAGAHSVIISSPSKLALIRDVDRDLPLEEIGRRFVQDVDLIISEGYKKDVQPKIEVFRKEIHRDLLCSPHDNLIAIVSNRTFNVGVPCFNLDDVKGLADLIEEKFLKARGSRPAVELRVNGSSVDLSPFVADLLKKTITAMVSTLRGCSEPRRIDIAIDMEKNLI